MPAAALAVEIAPAGQGKAALARVAVRSAGQGGLARIARRADGRPIVLSSGPAAVVAKADSRSLALAVAAIGGDSALGCDLEPVAMRPEREWRDLLGANRLELARLIGRELGEPLDDAATRVWSAGEALQKAGLPPGAPLVLGSAEGRSLSGWVLLSSGGPNGIVIATAIAPLEEPSARFALAVAHGARESATVGLGTGAGMEREPGIRVAAAPQVA